MKPVGSTNNNNNNNKDDDDDDDNDDDDNGDSPKNSHDKNMMSTKDIKTAVLNG